MTLVSDVLDLLHQDQTTAAILALPAFDDFAGLAGAILGRATASDPVGQAARAVYQNNPTLIEQATYDIAETARRNFEPGGMAATVLFSRGVQATMAHRAAHHLWNTGDRNQSLALKTTFGRAFATDMHPGAQIGAGFWLDHGLGFVIGETCVIEEDVSIWHGVTLGGTLNDNGPNRHPRVGRGAVIGAGAVILGGITIGAGANIAAGATVVTDVPPQTTMVGTKARNIGPARVSFAPKDIK